ncbi:unnamed protein product [Staurois parvus]|uniref:Uncharacterized protein n=1 Tax=Staurois parvus TaxID=386267 RepID=A0ABN9FN41_9NEOB|nr:unnamed protein product [Staurois parvus]
MKLAKMSLAIDSEIGDFYALCTSACDDPALSFYVAYHFLAGLLLFPIASTLL